MVSSKEWQARIAKVLRDYPTADVGTRNWESLLALATETKEVTTWRDFHSWAGGLKGKWCFRGEADKSWYLWCSLDRDVRKERTYSVGGLTSTSNAPMNFRLNESEMLIDFQRGAHHYYSSSSLPDVNRRIDWLALMQHHGAPTRLLDWTISPYVGLWFALENSSYTSDSSIWGINLDWLKERSIEMLKKHDPSYPVDADFHGICQYFNDIIFNEGNPRVIFCAEPMQVNQRMTAQQGLLLCNLNDTDIFSVVLLGMLIGKDVKPPRKQVVSRIIVKREQRIKFMEELRRMNIHNASIFPDLDGFARSLRSGLEIRLEHQIVEYKKEVGILLQKSRRKRKKSISRS